MRGRVEGVVGQAGGLSLDGLDHSGVAVAQVEHADTADEVDVTFAVGVPDFGITAMGKCDRVNDGNGLADTFLVHGARGPCSSFLLSKRVGGLFRKRIIRLRSFHGFVIWAVFWVGCAGLFAGKPAPTRGRDRSNQSPSATRSRIHCTKALILGTSAACSACAMKCLPLLATGWSQATTSLPSLSSSATR
ncbi:hypothetical protein D3C79_733900 [compost metagenome]